MRPGAGGRRCRRPLGGAGRSLRAADRGRLPDLRRPALPPGADKRRGRRRRVARMMARIAADADGAACEVSRAPDGQSRALRRGAGAGGVRRRRLRPAFARVWPARGRTMDAGGSHAQRDVFERLTIDAGSAPAGWTRPARSSRTAPAARRARGPATRPRGGDDRRGAAAIAGPRCRHRLRRAARRFAVIMAMTTTSQSSADRRPRPRSPDATGARRSATRGSTSSAGWRCSSS